MAVIFEITYHAIDRFALHDPAADSDSVRQAVERSIEIAPMAALPLIGRNSTKVTRSRYFLAEDRRGIFVAEDDGPVAVVITYLRFGPLQSSMALKIWPVEKKEAAAPVALAPKSDSIAETVKRILPCIGIPVSAVTIGPRLHSACGSNNKAKVALLKARVLISSDQEHVLQLETQRVRLRRVAHRWIAELDLA